MCQKNYNKKSKEKKYQHLNYVEKTQIERWYNIEKKPCSEIAKLLNKSVRTIQREIKRGLIENLTTHLEIKYVYSAEVSEQKYRYNMTAKGPNIKLDTNYKLVEYIENGIKKERKSPEILVAEMKRKKGPRVQVYYAHPYRSGERGSNENGNRLIRRFIPKGTAITNVSEDFIQEVENRINNLLRPMFGYKSSLEMAKLAS